MSTIDHAFFNHKIKELTGVEHMTDTEIVSIALSLAADKHTSARVIAKTAAYIIGELEALRISRTPGN